VITHSAQAAGDLLELRASHLAFVFALGIVALFARRVATGVKVIAPTSPPLADLQELLLVAVELVPLFLLLLLFASAFWVRLR